MNTNPLDPITHAYDECREHFDNYIFELQENLRFDSENPKDLLRFMSTFAGFCDSVDEAKNIVFEHFFMPYASEYFHHFKAVSEEDKARQRSNEEPCSVDGSLIDYVEAAESEEDFWQVLKLNSANICYLWNTSGGEGKDSISSRYWGLCKMQSELLEWYRQQNPKETQSRSHEPDLEDF